MDFAATSVLASKIPISRATASAVSLLSPVIMITRIPASLHSWMAAPTCARAQASVMGIQDVRSHKRSQIGAGLRSKAAWHRMLLCTIFLTQMCRTIVHTTLHAVLDKAPIEIRANSVDTENDELLYLKLIPPFTMSHTPVLVSSCNPVMQRLAASTVFYTGTSRRFLAVCERTSGRGGSMRPANPRNVRPLSMLA